MAEAIWENILREIQFRAWDIERHVMITSGIEYQIRALQMDIGDPNYLGFGFSPKEMEYFIFMRYVNSVDKNKVKIFEDDVVLFGRHYCGDYIVPEHAEIIKYEDNGFNDSLLVGYCDHPPWAEVIGNIHANPELRKCLGDKP